MKYTYIYIYTYVDFIYIIFILDFFVTIFVTELPEHVLWLSNILGCASAAHTPQRLRTERLRMAQGVREPKNMFWFLESKSILPRNEKTKMNFQKIKNQSKIN